MDRPNVVVVGAGLAGLACALELEARGFGCTILERDQRVGGRVQTDGLGGFRLDRGFQVLLTAYPETRRLLDGARLRLRPFFPGALIRHRGRFRLLADPWRRPLSGVRSLASGAVSLADGLRMARFRMRVRRGRNPSSGGEERTSLQRLQAEGFSHGIIARFFQPFFGGVFLERELATSERQLEFVFRMFSAGDIAVPSRGMGEIPMQLAGGLHRSRIRTGTEVERVDASGVRLAGGVRLDADAVVLATDGVSAAELAESVEDTVWRGVTCAYFAAPKPPVKGPILVLNGDGDGPINNLCVMSEVASDLAPAGQSLVSVTVIDDSGFEDLQQAVLDQLEDWFGGCVLQWKRLKTYRIDHALPDQSPPVSGVRPSKTEAGLFVCGDHWHDSSINGALASGRLAAEALVRDLAER